MILYDSTVIIHLEMCTPYNALIRCVCMIYIVVPMWATKPPTGQRRCERLVPFAPEEARGRGVRGLWPATALLSALARSAPVPCAGCGSLAESRWGDVSSEGLLQGGGREDGRCTWERGHQEVEGAV